MPIEHLDSAHLLLEGENVELLPGFIPKNTCIQKKKRLATIAEAHLDAVTQTEQDSRQKLEKLKLLFNEMVLHSATLSIENPITPTTDPILLQWMQNWIDLKKKIGDLHQRINNKWTAAIQTDYLPIAMDYISSGIEILKQRTEESKFIINEYSRRRELVYPETKNLQVLNVLQQTATHALVEHSQQFLIVLNRVQFELKDAETTHLKSALIQFIAELKQELEGNLLIQPQGSDTSQCRELIQGLENKFATWTGNTPIQTSMAVSFFNGFNLFGKRPQKNVSAQTQLKHQIFNAYQIITKIDRFPILLIKPYLDLKTKEYEFDQRVLIQNHELTLSIQSLVSELVRLLNLFSTESNEYQEAETLKTRLETELSQLNRTTDSQPIPKNETDLLLWLQQSIEEHHSNLSQKTKQQETAFSNLMTSQQLAKLSIEKLNQTYRKSKSAIALSFLKALNDAEKTAQLLDIKSNHETVKKLKELYFNLFEGTLDKNLNSLQDIRNKAITKLKENFNKIKEELIQLRKNKLTASYKQFIETNNSMVRFSPPNPFQYVFRVEKEQLHARVQAILIILEDIQGPLNFISSSEELKHWCQRFDAAYEPLHAKINTHKMTAIKAKEIERRLNTIPYKTAVQVIQTIQDEYSRIFNKYIVMKKNARIRDFIDSDLTSHFKLKQLTKSQQRLLDGVDERLAKLLLLNQHLNEINASFINPNLNLNDKSYLQFLLHLIENDFHNDRMEQLSQQKRLQFLHFFRIHVVKPLYQSLQKFLCYLNTCSHTAAYSQFFTPFPGKTEEKLRRVRNRSLKYLMDEKRLQDSQESGLEVGGNHSHCW